MQEINIEFENYEIVKILGQGGAGKVYLAKQINLDRFVAIKVINKSRGYSAELVDRGMREARILAKLQHPNIVNIYDTGEEDLYFYMVIEYIEHGSLEKEVAKNQNIKENDIWQITIQICQALQAALGEGIIHRDIKPENILLSKKDFAKISDFGISKVIETTMSITKEGTILGTPGFISPETAQFGTHDFRSDIYSLGVTIYYALTKRPLFEGKNILQLLFRHVNDLIEPPYNYNPTISPDANLIIAKMLQKDPNKRYQSYADLIIDIKSLYAKQSLIFANMEDAKRIYKPEHISKFSRQTKRITMTRRLRNMTEILVTPTNIKHVTIIGIWNIEHIQKYIINTTVNFVINAAEIKTYLSSDNFFLTKNVVVLDVDYLQEKTVEAFTLLRESFKDVHIFFTLENMFDDLESYKQYFFTYENLIRGIQNTSKFFKVSDIDLTLIIKLAKVQCWSFELQISEDDDISQISIEDGSVCKLQTTRDITNVQELFLKKDSTWKVIRNPEG